jgi:thioredoxin 1
MGVDEELEKIKREMMRRMSTPQPPRTTLKPGMVTDLTDLNFNSAIVGTEKPVLVDFWAEWCAPCKMMAPILNQLASEMSGRAFVAKLNVDQNPRTATQFGVMSIPNFIVFKDGRQAGQVVGAVGKANLVQLLQKFMV